MKDSRQQLVELLQETPCDARERERAAFTDAAEECDRIVILGAGRLGRKVLRGISDTGLKAVAFADNNPKMWGQTIDGLPVLSPDQAAECHAENAVFVAAVWHPSRSPLLAVLLDQLRRLHCRAIPFPVLFWSYPGKFLPYFFWDLPSRILEQRHDIAPAFDLINDEASRQAFVAQIRLRLSADVACLGHPDRREQYFPGLFPLLEDECFVDCGAYTGDTIRAFAAQANGRFRRLVAFEVDSEVLQHLQETASSFGPRVALHQAAVGSSSGIVGFAGDGMGGGCIAGSGSKQVSCVRLDDALAGERVTYIKMDIEGAEIQALEGAQNTIWRDRPVLAVCGYHTPDHLWRVPATLKTLAPDSQLFLRAHCADGLDTVWYSVPPERLPSAVSASAISANNMLARSQKVSS